VASTPSEHEIPLSDQTIRDKLLAHLRKQPWSHTAQLNVTVNQGVVDVWGICHSDAEREAVRIAAENIPGVRAVNNNLSMPPLGPIFLDRPRGASFGRRSGAWTFSPEGSRSNAPLAAPPPLLARR
jgi:hypothetical protein